MTYDPKTQALAETLTACAACFRVIARHDLADELDTELHEAGVRKGFGVRASEANNLGPLPYDPTIWQTKETAHK